jgi:hypothetical protein
VQRRVLLQALCVAAKKSERHYMHLEALRIQPADQIGYNAFEPAGFQIENRLNNPDPATAFS